MYDSPKAYDTNYIIIWVWKTYLDLLSDWDSIIFCRFRTDNYRIPIETGR